MDADSYRARMQMLRNKIQLKKHTAVVAAKGPSLNTSTSSASSVTPSGSAATSASRPISKRYKLGERERLLIEQMHKSDKDEEEYRPKTKKLKQMPNNMPVKGILKKNNVKEEEKIAQNNQVNVEKQQSDSTVIDNSLIADNKTSMNPSKKSSQSKNKMQESVSSDVGQEEEGQLPEGFFDDPVQDAKARKVEYVDKMDEEFARFQKEINVELESAMAVDHEEQGTATDERQLDEIEEQIRAWKKVNELERIVEEKRRLANVEEGQAENEDESGDEDEETNVEDVFGWRNKS